MAATDTESFSASSKRLLSIGPLLIIVSFPGYTIGAIALAPRRGNFGGISVANRRLGCIGGASRSDRDRPLPPASRRRPVPTQPWTRAQISIDYLIPTVRFGCGHRILVDQLRISDLFAHPRKPLFGTMISSQKSTQNTITRLRTRRWRQWLRDVPSRTTRATASHRINGQETLDR